MILAFGGPALFLLAQLLFQYPALGRVPPARTLGLGALAILAGASAELPLLAAIAAFNACSPRWRSPTPSNTGFRAPSRST